MALLELQNLTMRFGGLTAINDLNLRVEQGQIFSIIGPNGAGKTTVFNAVTGIYEPTAGTIKIDGRVPARPFTWKVLLACICFGLLTGLAAVLIAGNVDRLWRASIKQNTGDPAQPFTYAAAAQDGWAYTWGDLALEKQRNGRWAVMTPDGKKSLGQAKTQAEAETLKANLEEMAELGGSDETLEQRDGRWVVLSHDRQRVLATHLSAEVARTQLAALAEIAGSQAAKKRQVWIALVFGLGLGSMGTLTVWQRSRRTPEVIAQNGIARTFQNIRLFQNMTAVENVLTGMDRTSESSVDRALELLDFVGLANKADSLAKDLPYGDQRRLEIGRALATQPRLLLLDEPAAGMNPTEAAGLIALIRKIRDQGITVLLIEHHMNVVMGISDRIAVLDYGVKIAEGTPAEVRANPRVIEAYLGKEEVA